MLNNEALKGENKSNIVTFMITFVVIAAAAMVCCYLNYTFSTILSRYIFIMFGAAFLIDILVFRNLLIFMFSAITYLIAKARGYTTIPYKNSK